MNRRLVVFGAVFFFLALLACGLPPGSGISLLPSIPAQVGSGTAGQIEGTWLLTVTPPVPQIPPFKVLASFARGGAFTTSAEFTGGALVGPQNGAWKQIGNNEFASTGLAPGIMPDVNQPGLFKVQSIFQLAGKNNIAGSGGLSFCDTSGENCRTLPGCSAITGTRVQAEPPSCPQ